MLTRPPDFILLGALLLALSLTGCDSAADEAPEPVSFDAQVQLYIISDEGPPAYILSAGPRASYYPLNLPAAFQEEGVLVRVEGLLIKEYRVLLLQPVEITRIARIEGGML